MLTRQVRLIARFAQPAPASETPDAEAEVRSRPRLGETRSSGTLDAARGCVRRCPRGADVTCFDIARTTIDHAREFLREMARVSPARPHTGYSRELREAQGRYR